LWLCFVFLCCLWALVHGGWRLAVTPNYKAAAAMAIEIARQQGDIGADRAVVSAAKKEERKKAANRFHGIPILVHML
jgi:hypothetical protein